MKNSFAWGLWLLLLTAAFMAGFTGMSERKDSLINEYEGILRFHVIANSNSEEDQALKLQVRDYVVARLQNALQDSADINQSRRYIEENIDEINGWARNCIRAKGCEYEIKTDIGVIAIPARRYGDIYFPAGNYEAVTITIGKGEGRNWWCVIFPPLCMIDCDQELNNAAEGRIVLKSRLLEILRKDDKRR